MDPARTVKACILTGTHGASDSRAYLSHSGKLFLCQQDHAICLYSLNLTSDGSAYGGDSLPPASLIFSCPSLEWHDGVDSSDCSFFWSPDDSWVAIWYKVKNPRDPRSQIAVRQGRRGKMGGPDGHFDVVYAFDIATKEAHEVTYRKEVERLIAPSITADSKLLILPWTSLVFVTHVIDIYSRANLQLLARVSAGSKSEPSGAAPRYAHEHLRVSPSSTCFALACAPGVHVYGMDGSLKAVLDSVLRGLPGIRNQMCWSPDGSYLAIWQWGSPSTSLSIFETKHMMLVVGPIVEDHGHREQPGSLIWGLCGLVPIIRTIKQQGCCVSSSLSHVLAAWKWSGATETLSSPADARNPICDCMPAVSADGAFVAVLGKDKCHVHILDVLSGAHLSSCTIHGLGNHESVESSRCDSYTLAWAGRRLLVQYSADRTQSDFLTIMEF